MKTVLNVKIDRDIKKRAQYLAHEFGIPLSTIVNVHLRQFVRDKTLLASVAPRMSPLLESILGPLERDINRKRRIVGPVKTKQALREFFKNL